jgi:hypothetical protein
VRLSLAGRPETIELQSHRHPNRVDFHHAPEARNR